MVYLSTVPARIGVVLVAAGKGSRMGDVDKQTALLGGEPVISHSLKVFESYEDVGAVVLVMSVDNVEAGRRVVRDGSFSKVVDVVIGGDRRQDSVKIGMNVLATRPEGVPEFVLIHDGARPFVDSEMLTRGLSAAQKLGAAIAAVPVIDTIKIAPHKVVTSTPERSGMWAVQTPQIFRFDVLKIAHEIVTDDATDDASMVEQVGGLVGIFDGSYDNIKITTPSDLELASLILGRRKAELNGIGGSEGTGGQAQSGSRFGIGFDGHRLAEGGPLRLGGTDIEFDHHLEGHSDGDVLLHAVASAILGAAGLGDLGSRFPSSDASLVNIDSARFVAESARLAGEVGWLVDHLDATIIAQRPRLASFVPRMVTEIGMIEGLENASINVKITSTDHAGAIGAGEGIAAQAVATLIRAT
ncbi:MAG: 2-C-methyl-D-erythritol 4-phosphate cytidylyltransferase [Chloroflexi bacterium]|nr:2-C-methyl-D-erythritol 4-phosphate cytidylyltransferase [Chloroflexota bacterium]